MAPQPLPPARARPAQVPRCPRSSHIPLYVRTKHESRSTAALRMRGTGASLLLTLLMADHKESQLPRPTLCSCFVFRGDTLMTTIHAKGKAWVAPTKNTPDPFYYLNQSRDHRSLAAEARWDRKPIALHDVNQIAARKICGSRAAGSDTQASRVTRRDSCGSSTRRAAAGARVSQMTPLSHDQCHHYRGVLHFQLPLPPIEPADRPRRPGIAPACRQVAVPPLDALASAAQGEAKGSTGGGERGGGAGERRQDLYPTCVPKSVISSHPSPFAPCLRPLLPAADVCSESPAFVELLLRDVDLYALSRGARSTSASPPAAHTVTVTDSFYCNRPVTTLSALTYDCP
ncbi:unnamed protein product [Chrysodeixis includens]|uniref:Uncharacterized protein n=1 Tax=Chrysodeixis includens TaxID=689277 RepID=A0A9N8Q0A0_CHRIL|nr:unnamed protein product [Chrysodeixis includens]